jgi:hypothetical protein
MILFRAVVKSKKKTVFNYIDSLNTVHTNSVRFIRTKSQTNNACDNIGGNLMNKIFIL